jgi:MFS family permease
LLAGPLADRRGNRLALRLLILTSAAAPLVAIGVSRLTPAVGQSWYWTVFVLLGLTPVTMRTMVNYTLEIADPGEHPRYLATLGLCLAAPFCAAPAVGLLIDVTSFELVFLTGGGLLTYRLAEPRHEGRGRIGPVSAGGEE